MPLYEYECGDCGERFERIQGFSDPPEKVCPACGGTVEKLLSSPAIQFKGTGWYVTDYAKKSGAPASGEGAGKNDGAGAGTDAKAKKDGKGAKPASTSAGSSSSKSGSSSPTSK
ncbi:MAG: zinc ribbon domain-containing protein [Vicinamibacterales bacterium]|jgi:putative FmdB family regulatory protein|nr:transcriptional regulator [Acidobacteriota bacterium]MDP6371379.1 zinc ribbon domain-containing protein [Vicinamibacterales bacterium]MDP6610156.1 zinc ribbon domain-containing protein [Vicinamibacterales bacterium]HAK56765.1 transcriptional regulator [Acidobacteriota bacterium]|tara:strand:+ start:699 stop:1040 length:342 start_codon:yes stop_codon:yes gene_type:complete